MSPLQSKIKHKLIELDMSQKELAEILQVSPQLLSAVLNSSISSLVLEIRLEQWLNKPQNTA